MTIRKHICHSIEYLSYLVIPSSLQVTCSLKAFAPSGRADPEGVHVFRMTVSILAAAVVAVMLAAPFTVTGSPDRRLLQNGDRLSIAI